MTLKTRHFLPPYCKSDRNLFSLIDVNYTLSSNLNKKLTPFVFKVPLHKKHMYQRLTLPWGEHDCVFRRGWRGNSSTMVAWCIRQATWLLRGKTREQTTESFSGPLPIVPWKGVVLGVSLPNKISSMQSYCLASWTGHFSGPDALNSVWTLVVRCLQSRV